MRLATLRAGEGYRLALATGRGLVDVAASLPELADVGDVGQLIARGEPVLAAVRQLAAEPERAVPYAGAPAFGPPVPAPEKIIGIGLNYRRHAAEGGVDVPDEPILFAKFASSLVGPDEPVIHHALTDRLDYEGELAIVIGRVACGVAAAAALDYVAGYMCANDVSARDLQHDRPGGQWVHGKALDTFCPTGPFLVTPEEAGDWRELRIQTRVNGELRQDELCADMVFGIEELIAFISSGITLRPGDIILTGTPSGVGLGFDPPRWLRPGDSVEVEITRLGILNSPIVAPEDPAVSPVQTD